MINKKKQCSQSTLSKRTSELRLQRSQPHKQEARLLRLGNARTAARVSRRKQSVYGIIPGFLVISCCALLACKLSLVQASTGTGGGPASSTTFRPLRPPPPLFAHANVPNDASQPRERSKPGSNSKGDMDEATCWESRGEENVNPRLPRSLEARPPPPPANPTTHKLEAQRDMHSTAHVATQPVMQRPPPPPPPRLLREKDQGQNDREARVNPDPHGSLRRIDGIPRDGYPRTSKREPLEPSPPPSHTAPSISARGGPSANDSGQQRPPRHGLSSGSRITTESWTGEAESSSQHYGSNRNRAAQAFVDGSLVDHAANRLDPATYQRVPPPQQKPVYPGNRRPSTPLPTGPATSSWKNIWSKLGSSLDSLADWEGELQSRAATLSSKVAGNLFKNRSRHLVSLVGSRGKASPTEASVTSSSTVCSESPWQRSMRNKYGSIGEANNRPASQENGNPPIQRQLMIANGGSSAPPDRTSKGPQKLAAQSSSGEWLKQPATDSAVHGAASQAFSPSVVKPFSASPHPPAGPSILQQAPQSPKQRQALTATSNPFGASTASAFRAPDTRTPRKYTLADSDDDESRFSLSNIFKMMPPIPRLPLPRLFRQGGSFRRDEALAALDLWKADDEQDRTGGLLSKLFRWARQSPEKDTLVFSRQHGEVSDEAIPKLLQDLMARCQNGKSSALLTKEDRQRGGAMGQTLALLDGLILGSLLVIVRELRVGDLQMPASLHQLAFDTMPALFSAFVGAMDGWMPIVLAILYLSFKTIELVYVNQIEPLCNTVAESLQQETMTGSLFLRLYMGVPVDRHMATRMEDAVKAQVREKVAVARLRLFVFNLLVLLMTMTVVILQPLAKVAFSFVSQMISLEEWFSWPIAWQQLSAHTQQLWTQFCSSSAVLMNQAMMHITKDPMKVAYELTLFGVLAAAAYMPRLEKLRVPKSTQSVDEEELEAAQLHVRFTESLEDLGSSSGTRLCALSEMNAIESGLERWRLMLTTESELATSLSTASFLRIVVYSLLAGLTIFAPIIVFAYGGIVRFGISGSQLQWNSLLDVSLMLVLTHRLLVKALSSAVFAKETEGNIVDFLSTVGKAVDSRLLEKNSQPSLELQASINPMAGLVVKDLWAAHTTKRAWAVRGASLEARSAEVLVLFGEGGSGKTRLLTTLAEAITDPPREALTTTRVRGSTTVCGVETTRWDRRLLRRRLGLLLNDVQTLSSVSKAFSGMSIEEILEPSSTQRSPEAARNAMILGLKITGLYASLIPRLPNKLASIVTAVEEDLRPSTLRPRSILLSPVEWSKLLLARVLAQAIYDNDNSASSGDNIDKCLVGSVLLLDDATAHLSEVEEALLFRELRRTGAAIILASNRWAAGRLADRIAVLKDGAIMEAGTHNQLLSRGPQYSLYAAQWNAMATT